LVLAQTLHQYHLQAKPFPLIDLQAQSPSTDPHADQKQLFASLQHPHDKNKILLTNNLLQA
jgi:hypothetical protein